jgi:SAM-dependent methyltransferase
MMTPSRHLVSAAAHELVPHANPLSVDQMVALIAQVASRRPRTAIDIGCGPGRFSVGLASREAVNIRAVDLNHAFLERARQDASQTALVGSIDFQERPLLADEGAQFDVVVCIGSSGAIGRPLEARQRCKQLMTETEPWSLLISFGRDKLLKRFCRSWVCMSLTTGVKKTAAVSLSASA